MKIAFSRCARFVLIAALTVGLALPLCAADAPPKTAWLGLYFNGKKIGYTSLLTQPAAYRGKQGFKMSSIAVARIELLGNKVSQDSESTTYTDAAHRPVYQEYKISSNGSAITLQAEYLADKIVCTINSGGGPSRKEVPIPPGANLVGDSSNVTQGQKIAPGLKATYYYLNPLTISLEKTDTEVEAKEQVTLNGRSYAAFRVSSTTPFGKLISWNTEDGETLKGDLPLGMAMFREEKDAALNLNSPSPKFAVVGGGAASAAKSVYAPSDIAIATAITTDKPIENPRTARLLALTIAGIEDKARVLSDKRQQVTASDKPGVYAYRIQAENFDAARSAALPIRESGVQTHLQRAPYLETDDPSIRDTAATLRGGETNAYRVAARIRAWVHANMTPDYTIGVPRSCADVYKRRKGVCRDYATLFAGIARAAGIPTRVAGGIVYAEGKFFYHAWAECWVGEWVAFDPTMKEDFVDATHIKFAQGDVTEMYNVAGVIGRLKVSVGEAQ